MRRNHRHHGNDTERDGDRHVDEHKRQHRGKQHQHHRHRGLSAKAVGERNRLRIARRCLVGNEIDQMRHLGDHDQCRGNGNH